VSIHALTCKSRLSSTGDKITWKLRDTVLKLVSLSSHIGWRRYLALKYRFSRKRSTTEYILFAQRIRVESTVFFVMLQSVTLKSCSIIHVRYMLNCFLQFVEKLDEFVTSHSTNSTILSLSYSLCYNPLCPRKGTDGLTERMLVEWG